MAMSSRIPQSIQPLLDAYLHALEPLQAHIHGIYIYGSIALGAFEEQESDIDIVVLISLCLGWQDSCCRSF